MINPWFRLYSEILFDAKVQMMPEHYRWRLIALMCLRCNVTETLHDDQIAFQLRINIDDWLETKKVFVSKNFIDNKNYLVNWNKRQFISDSSAARVRKHREAKKTECNDNVTLQKRVCNDIVTSPDTDTDTDTEDKNQKSTYVNFCQKNLKHDTNSLAEKIQHRTKNQQSQNSTNETEIQNQTKMQNSNLTKNDATAIAEQGELLPMQPNQDNAVEERFDGKKSIKRRTECPEGFEVTEHHRELAKTNGWENLDIQIVEFKDYHISKGNKFVDWDRAFYTWLRNAKRFDKSSKFNGRQINKEMQERIKISYVKVFESNQNVLPVNIWTSEDAANLQARIDENPAFRTVQAWHDFFMQISTLRKLMGLQPLSNGERFSLSLSFIVREKNFAAICNGNWDNK